MKQWKKAVTCLILILNVGWVLNGKISKRAGLYIGYSFGRSWLNTGLNYYTEINTYNFGLFVELSLDKGRGLALSLNNQRLVRSETSTDPRTGEVTDLDYGINATDLSINYLWHGKRIEKFGFEAELGFGWRFSPAAFIGNFAFGLRFPLRMKKTRFQLMAFFRPVGYLGRGPTIYEMTYCWGMKLVFDYQI